MNFAVRGFDNEAKQRKIKRKYDKLFKYDVYHYKMDYNQQG